jgi:hypothetical protein
VKECRDCLSLKSLDEFPPQQRRVDGRGSYCRDCMRIRSTKSYRKRAAARGRAVREKREVPEGFAYCPACTAVKPLEEFGRNRASRTGRTAYCKPCHNAKGKETYTRLYGSTRDYHLRRRYGITSADVDALIAAQGGVCALCRERTPEHVDHDHLNGRVRGVLCSCCNQGLGNFRDRSDILRTAIDYLERTTWTRQRVDTGVYRLTSPRPAARPSASSSELQHLISSRRG